MNYWKIVITVLLSGLFLYLLYWRWQVGITRFFDVDEFSYLHWAGQIARGERQYIDFLSYFSPGYFWVLTPIFWIIGFSAQVFVVARVVEFVFFLGLLAALGILFGITRGWKWALLPAIILAFLPMPYDKFLEVRPDTLAVLFAVLGIIGEIQALDGKKNTWWFISGLLYSISLFILAKTIPLVAVGAGIACFTGRKKLRTYTYFFTGLVAPWALYFAYTMATGQFPVVWYSLTKLVFEVSSPKLGPMVATLFFYPNASFYGGDNSSISIGLIVNHAVWILGILAGAYRVVTSKSWKDLLIGLSFFISVWFYVKYFPLKHSQYLIPIAFYIAYYAADALSGFFDWLVKAGGYASALIVLLGFAYMLFVVTIDVNSPKLAMTNEAQLASIVRLLQTVPRTARVVDIEGRMVFWPSGYPICCVPFDWSFPYITKGPPILWEYLTTYPADYIYQGDSDRLSSLLPENAAYVKAHYEPVPGWGDTLWKKK